MIYSWILFKRRLKESKDRPCHLHTKAGRYMFQFDYFLVLWTWNCQIAAFLGLLYLNFTKGVSFDGCKSKNYGKIWFVTYHRLSCAQTPVWPFLALTLLTTFQKKIWYEWYLNGKPKRLTRGFWSKIWDDIIKGLSGWDIKRPDLYGGPCNQIHSLCFISNAL